MGCVSVTSERCDERAVRRASGATSERCDERAVRRVCYSHLLHSAAVGISSSTTADICKSLYKVFCGREGRIVLVASLIMAGGYSWGVVVVAIVVVVAVVMLCSPLPLNDSPSSC